MISFPNQNFKKVPFKPVNLNGFNKPFTPIPIGIKDRHGRQIKAHEKPNAVADWLANLWKRNPVADESWNDIPLDPIPPEIIYYNTDTITVEELIEIIKKLLF